MTTPRINFIALLLTAMLANISQADTPARKPNILLVYSDNHGWADLGAQGVNKEIQTPHLDQLTRDVVRFARGYVSVPQDVPSRVGLITGRYQKCFGAADNNKGPLPQDELTFPERLKMAGFVSGWVGKSLGHIGGEKGQGKELRVLRDHMPHRQGFDEYFQGEMRQYLVSTRSQPDADSVKFGVEEQNDRLRISLDGQPIVDFVFQDKQTLRPYFANARLANGVQITRNHPPVKGVDEVDHDTMHPGIWLGVGDINGQDFWRNKAAMEHVRFVTPPNLEAGRLQFSTECQLKSQSGEPVCRLVNEFMLRARPTGWLLKWTATFRADQGPLKFGDQEEMGFGARIATPFTEKNGGVIRSSAGKQTAKETWGQPAKWCDYSGSGQPSGGIMLMASDNNFRGSWWHNRDYGVFVANPFGRQAMKQGPRSTLTIAQGETLKLTFGALIHDENDFQPDAEFEAFQKLP